MELESLDTKTLTTTMSGGTQEVLLMWCSSPIGSEQIENDSERDWETHIKYKNMPDIWIICFTRLEIVQGNSKTCHYIIPVYYDFHAMDS